LGLVNLDNGVVVPASSPAWKCGSRFQKAVLRPNRRLVLYKLCAEPGAKLL
jgi:hypothetical protein